MSFGESNLDQSKETTLSINGPIYDWRSALRANPEMQEVFESLNDEGRMLIEWRLDLQRDTGAAQTEVHRAKTVFDTLVEARIRGELVDSNELDDTALQMSEAYQRCVAVTTEIMQVEVLLSQRGLPSEPFLWLTQRRDGQALADPYEGSTVRASRQVIPQQRSVTELQGVGVL